MPVLPDMQSYLDVQRVMPVAGICNPSSLYSYYFQSVIS